LRWLQGGFYHWAVGAAQVEQIKSQVAWVAATIGLTAIWMGFLYFFQPNEIGTFATAGATACLIALIQHHKKPRA